MSKRASVYALVAVALTVAVGAVRYGYTEISALAWHVQHGFHAERGGIRFRIPLSFEADVSSGLPTLTLTKRGGRIWAGGGVILVFFGKHPSLEARQAGEAMAEARLAKRGLGMKRKSVGERTDVLAGRPGKCIESIPVIDQVRLQQDFEKRDMRDIECSFGDDVEVEFIGTGNLKDDFYNMIQTAEPVQRKL